MWRDCYNEVIVTDYINDYKTKWEREGKDLKVGDFVYFQKKGGNLTKDYDWAVGRISHLFPSTDGEDRKATINYALPGEDEATQYTDRAVRAIIKLTDLDKGAWMREMEEVERKYKECGINIEGIGSSKYEDTPMEVQQPLFCAF